MNPFALKYFKSCLLIGVVLLIISSCQSEPKKSETNTEEPSVNESANTSASPNQSRAYQADDILYSWVDQLNIRKKPGMDSRVTTTVDSDAALKFTGERSDQTEVLVLRGVAYDEHWLRVLTPDNKKGWVFGGAVKRTDEEKGNATINDTRFDFPHFGSFDLNEWNNISSNDESGGDAENTISTYTKDKLVLEITMTEVGEYGYSRTFKLFESDNTLLRERVFSFAADADLKVLTETVKNYKSTPPIEYTRTQKLGKHFMQLNAKPLMVNGVWSQKPLEATRDSIQ